MTCGHGFEWVAGAWNRKCVIEFIDGTCVPGIAVYINNTQDVAICYPFLGGGKVYTPISIGDFDELKVGHPIGTIGFTGSIKKMVLSQGVLGARDLFWEMPSVKQTPVRRKIFVGDMNINHGNSGGPLLNSEGHAVGIIQVERSKVEDLLTLEDPLDPNCEPACIEIGIPLGQALGIPMGKVLSLLKYVPEWY